MPSKGPEFTRSLEDVFGGDCVRAVEIFAGAGGLALGVSEAGFIHDAVIELDAYACATIRANQKRHIKPIVDWPLFEQDISDFDFSTIAEGLDLLCGGPPCQPFSLAGKSLGRRDDRDLFPQAVRAVRELRPRAFVFENVKGLLRKSHIAYSEYVRLQLTCPQVHKKHREKWTEHCSRLQRCYTRGAYKEETYKVIVHVVNAADYGIPQRRERVFIVGIRSDLDVEWSFPLPTHSRDELLISKFVTDDYWEHHRVSRKKRKCISESLRSRLTKKNVEANPNRLGRWRTVRDAFADLPSPGKSERGTIIPNHRFIPGARAYEGHTGSEIDEPAKTLKAGNHGVPGGENMMIHTNGKVRYFTVREKARLQTFPDNYHFDGPWSATTRQLGNAVPVLLSSLVAKSIGRTLSSVRVV
jgi:DNA (cytosine-5)-methyltransferase 1